MIKNIIFLWQSVDIGPRKISGKENHYKPHYFDFAMTCIVFIDSPTLR